MTENKIRAHVARLLRRQGAEVIPMVAGDFRPAGIPDLLVWHASGCYLIEIKGAKTRATPKQLHELKTLDARRPGCAVLARAVEGRELTSCHVWWPNERHPEWTCEWSELLKLLLAVREEIAWT
jgi:Holliday junction resolvase